MFNQNDKVRLQAINTYSKGFEFLKDETNSPLTIELPAVELLSSINFPEKVLAFEIYEIHEGDVSYKQLIHRIYIGETHTIEQMDDIDPTFRISKAVNIRKLDSLSHDAPCVFFKVDENKFALLAALEETDIVVPNASDLNEALIKISLDFIMVQKGMSRIRNINKNPLSKHI